MKRQHLTIGLTVLAVAFALGILLHSILSTRQDFSQQQPAPAVAANQTPAANAPKPPKTPKTPKATLPPASLPPEILAAVKAALPEASIESAQENQGKYKLKLAAGGKTSSAQFKIANAQVSGSVSENLPASAMPPVIAAAFQAAVPEGKIESLSKVVFIGGNRDGQGVYQWDWNNGNNADGEASLDGKQILMKDEIPAGQLPATVTDALAKAYPQAALDKKVKRRIENGQISYELSVKPADGGKKIKITATAAGELQVK